MEAGVGCNDSGRWSPGGGYSADGSDDLDCANAAGKGKERSTESAREDDGAGAANGRRADDRYGRWEKFAS